MKKNSTFAAQPNAGFGAFALLQGSCCPPETHTHSTSIPLLSSSAALSAHLLLSQDQHPLGLDGVVRRQVLAAAPRHAVLEGLPDAVPGGPGDAQVVPLAVVDEEGQLCLLRQRFCVSAATRSRCPTLPSMPTPPPPRTLTDRGSRASSHLISGFLLQVSPL